MRPLILFAIPLLMGELLQNLYNSVDALVVGNFVSDTALGAVSVCATLSMLIVGFFNGISIGTTVVVSRVYGSKNEIKLKKYICVIFTATVLLGLSLSASGTLLTKVLVNISKADPEIFAEAVIYLRIYLAGIMFTVIYNVGAGILRAIGDSRTPFLILTFSGILNILLDFGFVLLMHLGVGGVALATVVSQFMSALFIFLQVNIHIGMSSFSFAELTHDSKGIITEVMEIGIPSGIQNALIAFSNLFVWRYVNAFGKAATAGVGICQRVEKFVSLPVKACGNTTAAFISQNIGAEDYPRARKGTFYCVGTTLGVGLILECIFIVFAYPVCRIFNQNSEIIDVAATMVKTIFPFYVTFAAREVLYGILRGHGYAKITMVLSLLGMVGVRQLFLAIFCRIWPSIWTVYYCYPVAWASTALFIFVYYFYLRKKTNWGKC